MATQHVTALLALVVVVVVALPAVLACQPPFTLLEGKWCVLVNITAPAVAYTWPQARKDCQRHGDLVILDSEEKLRAITRHLNANYIDKVSHPYWVGGTRESGEWRWVDNTSMNLHSNMWIPGVPNPNNPNNLYTILINTNPWNRRYIHDFGVGEEGPAYLCEKRRQ